MIIATHIYSIKLPPHPKTSFLLPLPRPFLLPPFIPLLFIFLLFFSLSLQLFFLFVFLYVCRYGVYVQDIENLSVTTPSKENGSLYQQLSTAKFLSKQPSLESIHSISPRILIGLCYRSCPGYYSCCEIIITVVMPSPMTAFHNTLIFMWLFHYLLLFCTSP